MILEKGMQKEQESLVLPEHLALGKRLDERSPLVSVGWCGETVGWGLFAEEDLEEDVIVGEYTGHVRKNDDHLSINNYLYAYPIDDPIGRNYVIDATHGNLTRFINHSFWPNLKPCYAFSQGLYHVLLITLYPIKKGKQLSYDYGRLYWFVRSPPENFNA